jgi:hypothetical protein
MQNFEKLAEWRSARIAKGSFFAALPNCQIPYDSPVKNAKEKTHRMLAWGVLGSASDGLPFLLTHPVVFRSY